MLVERLKPADDRQEKKPRLPIGEGKELAKFAREEWQRHLLLFSQVKNKVLEVNPNVYIPLKLKEGEASPLGLFVNAAFLEEPKEIPKGEQALEVWPEHRRSSFLGRVFFKDKEGLIYRDVDIKGIGFVSINREGKAIISPLVGDKWSEDEEERRGLLDYDVSLFDYEMSEKFIKSGIRTYRVLAIIGLEELIVDGRKISLEKAIKKRIIDKNFHPVVEVRAYCGTKARIIDAWDNYLSKEKRKLLLEDAKKIFTQEFNLKTSSDEEYLKKFAEVLGHNIGLMHKNSWIHNYLNPHNITLGCQIVDLDSISVFDHEGARKDFLNAQNIISYLWQNLIEKHSETSTGECEEIFEKSYNAVFPKEEQRTKNKE